MKFLKDDIDRSVFRDRVEMDISGVRVYISPIDIQIAYKIFLGSQKDIEDTLHLWEIFKDDINHEHVKKWMKTFGVRGG